MNLYILTESDGSPIADKTAAAVTSMSDTTPLEDLGNLVLGDSVYIELKFTTAAGTAPAFAGAATSTPILTLGVLTSDGSCYYAEATDFTAITSGWSARMALTTEALVSAINILGGGYGRPRGGWLTMQVQVTDYNGKTQTYALPKVFIEWRVVAPTSLEPLTPIDEVLANPANVLALRDALGITVPAAELFGYNAPTAISAAGNTNLTLAAGQAQRVEKITVSAGSAAYTATLTLQSTNAVAGYEIQGQVNVAASFNPLVQLRNLTAGGTLLGSITGDGVARVWNFTARFDGTNWFLTSLAKQRSASIDELNNAVNPRAPAQGLVFDGMAPATWAGYTAGTGDLTAHLVFSAASVTAEQRLLSGPTNAFALGIKSSKIQVATENAALVGESSAILVAGKETAVTVVRASGTTTIYINGVSAGSFADTTDYSAATTTLGRFGASALFLFTGSIKSGPYLENRALPATGAGSILELTETGAPAAGDYNNASNTGLVTGDDSTFASDTSFWTKTGDATINNAGSGVAAFTTGDIRKTGITASGKRYRIAVTVGGAGTLRVSDGTAATIIGTAGAQTLEWVSYSTTIIFQAVLGAITIDNLTVTPLGLLLAPEAAAPGNGYLLNPAPGVAHTPIVLPASGVSFALPDNRTNRIRGTTNTSGNQQLLGASVLLPANSQILRVRARSRSGTPSITIGTASGGNQIVASVALSTTWQNLTIALTGGIVSAADDIWIGSNSTDIVETDISWEPLSF